LEGKEIAKGKEERAVAGHAEILLDGSQTPSMLVVGKNKSSLYFGYLLSFSTEFFLSFCLLCELSHSKPAQQIMSAAAHGGKDLVAQICCTIQIYEEIWPSFV